VPAAFEVGRIGCELEALTRTRKLHFENLADVRRGTVRHHDDAVGALGCHWPFVLSAFGGLLSTRSGRRPNKKTAALDVWPGDSGAAVGPSLDSGAVTLTASTTALTNRVPIQGDREIPINSVC
jgi:hypothetical protein